MLENVYQAYDSGDYHALSKELLDFRSELISKVQAVGPAAVVLQLGDERQRMTDILTKIEAKASVEPREFVAFLAGFVRAYVGYFELIVNLDDVDSADAELSAGRDQHDRVTLIRMMILKATFTHAGVRAKELVRLVARAADVKESAVKFHVRKVVDIGLVKRIELGRKAVSYRISPLGEALLSRRSKPYELALLFIDEAAFDDSLRAAIEKEINLAWLPDQPNQEVVSTEPLPSFSYSRPQLVTREAEGLNDRVSRYERTYRAA